MSNVNGCMYDFEVGHFLSPDLLGSITAVVPAASGAAIEYRSYDAWGRVRNPNDWSFNNIPAFSVIDRGYTFHEHLPEFGLINMNGRMYDPLVGRFLSPDPYVQDPGTGIATVVVPPFVGQFLYYTFLHDYFRRGIA